MTILTDDLSSFSPKRFESYSIKLIKDYQGGIC